MLDFFTGVPQPQLAHALRGLGQHLGMLQQPGGQDGGQVLNGSGHCHFVAWVLEGIHAPKAFGQARGPVVAVTQASQVLVVQVVQPAVGGLLADKTLDLGSPVGLLILRQVSQANAQRIHEKLLAHRKTHRQGIEQSAQKRVVTVPMSIHGGLHVDQQLSDGQVVHVCQ